MMLEMFSNIILEIVIHDFLEVLDNLDILDVSSGYIDIPAIQ